MAKAKYYRYAGLVVRVYEEKLEVVNQHGRRAVASKGLCSLPRRYRAQIQAAADARHAQEAL